jgi:hypothetical protein
MEKRKSKCRSVPVAVEQVERFIAAKCELVLRSHIPFKTFYAAFERWGLEEAGIADPCGPRYFSFALKCIPGEFEVWRGWVNGLRLRADEKKPADAG